MLDGNYEFEEVLPQDIKIGSLDAKFLKGRKAVFKLEQQLLAEYRKKSDKCPICDAVWKLTIDHIIPYELLERLGYSPKTYFIPANLRILCERCNGYKSSRLDFSIPQTKHLLTEIIGSI